MRKIISISFFLLGILIFSIGVYLNFNQETKNDKEKGKDKEQQNETLKFNMVNNYNLKETCTTYDPVSTYMYFTDFTKVTFNYPNCVHEYNLSHWMKQLSDEQINDKMMITISRESDEPKTILNKKKTTTIGYKNNGMYADVEYSDFTELTLKNGLKVYAFQYNYKTDLIMSSIFSNQWYIIVEINESNNLMFDINIEDDMMSQKAILDMLESIKIDEVETIKNSNSEGDYQVGTIKQNSYKKYDRGYMLTYKVNNKYPEVETTATNINDTVFKYEDINKEIYVEYELKSSYRTTLEEAQSFNKVSAKEESDTERNIKNGELIQKEINGKKIIYFVNSYDYYSNNKKSCTYYRSYVYYEIEPNLFLVIYISNKNHEINEAFISEFLDFTVEEF